MPKTIKPNLFVIGAMKSGTTSMHSYLSAHPEIFMCTPKEPCHFIERNQLRKVWPEMEQRGYWQVDKYLKLFKDAGQLRYRGESSVDYTSMNKVSGVARRIADFVDDARFIYVIRDPVERAISHYWHECKMQREFQEMEVAVRRDNQYQEISHYAMQLAPYIEQFGLERIKIVMFEELKNKPVEVMRDVFQWLGLNTEVAPDVIGQQFNATPEVVQRATYWGLLFRIPKSKLWQTLRPLIPQWVRNTGTQLATRKVDRGQINIDAVIDYLRPIQLRQTEELSALLGRSFPEWKVLYGGTPSS